MAVMGMSANPIGAHQVCRDMADRRVIRFAAHFEFVGRAVIFDTIYHVDSTARPVTI